MRVEAVKRKVRWTFRKADIEGVRKRAFAFGAGVAMVSAWRSFHVMTGRSRRPSSDQCLLMVSLSNHEGSILEAGKADLGFHAAQNRLGMSARVD